MKKIICKNCGEVTRFGQKEIVYRTLIFDKNGKPYGATDDIGISTGIPRCLKCNSKVKFTEDEEADNDIARFPAIIEAEYGK